MTERLKVRGRLAPTAAQCLLLRAALLDAPAGRQAWEQWRRETDVERLDDGSQRLLPQLYCNARSYAAGEPLLDRLKGVYRHTWSANELLLRDAGRLLRTLNLAGIGIVVLDGTALLARYYPDRGARAAESLGLMVAPGDVPRAAAALEQEGWRAADPAGPPRPGPYAGQARLLGGHCPVDLLWDPFPEGCTPGIRDAFWAASESGEVAELACRVLAPTDDLLRICVRASRWEPIPSFRRLADASMLLRSAGAAVDWDRLADHARTTRVVLPVLAALSLLREVLDAPIPDRVLERLERVRVTAADRAEQRLGEAPHTRLGRMPDLWLRYRRLAVAQGEHPQGWMRYLQGAWAVRRPWQLPLVAVQKGVRRAFRGARPV